ncbi:hypothetical protein [Natrialba taiwanensis]|uniref:Uncharacterized protein n=1 Tax=Natrialba taiwanensis DSM 12281 TaxID=1230458 RepID=L9ZHW7_9EURY|nr:hypothetical protein [Natrialba taiwanensis]ELY84758.1 hypothetical protein C484_21463 [Natrialba taiwanensis DSM 12281]
MGQPAAARIRTELREFWEFYRGYTKTAIHAATAAGLTIFGLLIFIDPWFAAIAIACYVVPPVTLYLLKVNSIWEAGDSERDRRGVKESRRDRVPETDTDAGSAEPETALIHPPSGSDATAGSASGDGDTDTDTDTDSDSDSDDGDTDTDTDSGGNGDTDSNTDDGDTDSDTDTDDGDTDSDSDSDG